MLATVIALESSIQLVPDGTLLIHVGIVLLMVAVLNRTLFKPIIRILIEREKHGAGLLSEVAEIRRRVATSNEEIENAMHEARSAGYKLIEEQRNESLKERERLLTSLKTEIEAVTEQKRASVEIESKEASNTIASGSTSLAEEIRDRILKPLRGAGRAV